MPLKTSPHSPTAREAALLMKATFAISMLGIFFGIFWFFLDVNISVRIAAATLVGIVGILSCIRHSVYYESDQVRMGWHQEHPEFQLEVGYANFAIGIWGLIISVFNGGAFACGLILAVYATYLLCTFFLHLSGTRGSTGSPINKDQGRAIRSTFTTGFYVIVLSGFAFISFAQAGILPIFHP